MRAFWRIRVGVRRWLARHTTVIEFCKRCGATVGVIWTADDALWRRVHGREGGVLCIRCFDRMAEQQGLLLRWVPRVESGR